MPTPSRRHLAAIAAVLYCCSLLTPVAAAPGGSVDVAGGATNQSAPADPCVGTVTEPANGTTVIAVQGYRFGEGGGKRPAKLVGVGPRGEIEWVHQSGKELNVGWGYDVDPMDNGNVFVTATTRNHTTIVYEFDPTRQEVVWTKEFDVADTHDADLIDDGSAILVANMRNYDETTGENDDRLFVYNRTTDEITWEWRFADHYDRSEISENFTDDWTHVNDVDEIGDGLYLASPRNFDQAIVVNRSTNEIVMKLGADEQLDVLDEQHNPDYLESENGTPTLLVGDSNNDRIVEYANPDGDLTDGDGWNRTWTLEGNLSWPRDADRLADGDTLVTDSKHERIVEVTPTGEVVWEVYAPWLVYDAARLEDGEHDGPTVTDLNASGTYEIHGGSDVYANDSALEACDARLANVSGWVEGEEPTITTTESTDDGDGLLGGNGGDGDSSPSGDGDDNGSGSIPGFAPVAAVAALLVALALAMARREE